ncbi:hypothetical protein [Bacillus sp. M6-12]|nr:hypothetical protein [Bacillus sp. M6-12]
MSPDKECIGSYTSHETKRQLCEEVANLAVHPWKEDVLASTFGTIRRL